MRRLSDLISDIKKEIRQVPIENAAVLTVLGFEVQEKVKSMIGTHQVFWKDLADSTVDQKRRKGWGKGGDPSSPLYATGKYEESVQYRMVGKNRVQIFSDDEHAEYLEFGTSKMPPRSVFLPSAKLVLKDWMNNNKLPAFYLKNLR
jgi:hypothetical protein